MVEKLSCERKVMVSTQRLSFNKKVIESTKNYWVNEKVIVQTKKGKGLKIKFYLTIFISKYVKQKDCGIYLSCSQAFLTKSPIFQTFCLAESNLHHGCFRWHKKTFFFAFFLIHSKKSGQPTCLKFTRQILINLK